MKLLAIICMCAFSAVLFAQQPEPGHSHFGGAFDEGPRTFATLMPGNADINFETDRCLPNTKKFINQGVAQLHGFLNYEAERSFRHAAYLDSNCITAFIGLALTNTIWVRNYKRAIAFAAEARKRLTSQHSQRSRLYVEALEGLQAQRSEALQFAKGLQNIYQKYPGDLDAKAFFVITVWQAKNLYREFGMERRNQKETLAQLNRIAQEVLAADPNHPIHHYVVHMWDTPELYQNALYSADQIGFSGPAVAHMWHMAGHIYHHDNSPFEAAWSQEASARVDHKYMARKKVFPFMLHNHAHNNEWLTRTLTKIADYDKAWKVALNLIGQPKHPTLNHAAQYQHFRTGNQRVLDLIDRGGYWQLGQKLFRSPFLQCAKLQKFESAKTNCERVKALTDLRYGRTVDPTKQSSPAYKQEIQAAQSLFNRNQVSASLAALSNLKHLKEDWGLYTLLRYHERATSDRRVIAKRLIQQNDRNVQFLLAAALAYAEQGEQNTAKRLVARAQFFSERVTLAAPEISRLATRLAAYGFVIDKKWKSPFRGWRKIHSQRPKLEKLGPLTWQPIKAPDFNFIDKNNNNYNFYRQSRGKPTLLVFLLNECPLCDLQAKTISDRRNDFVALGIEVVTVTSQEQNHGAFLKYRAYDQFESFPIHGIHLINQQKEIVWEDISAEAFMDINFILEEAKRVFHPMHRKIVQGNYKGL